LQNTCGENWLGFEDYLLKFRLLRGVDESGNAALQDLTPLFCAYGQLITSKNAALQDLISLP
jgi:hypothetical protein